MIIFAYKSEIIPNNYMIYCIHAQQSLKQMIGRGGGGGGGGSGDGRDEGKVMIIHISY